MNEELKEGEEWTYPHNDIEAAYNAILATESIDIAVFGGKRMEARIKRNALKIIDRALQYMCAFYDDEEDDEE